MKLLSQFALINVLYLSAFQVSADDLQYYNEFQQSSTNANNQNLAKYLLNLGSFLGYDIKHKNKEPVNQELLNLTATRVVQNYLFNTFLGAMPVNAVSQVLAQFLPSNFPGYTSINGLANYTFTSQPYSSPSQQQGTVSVSSLIDQKTYQQDPVSQSVLNILGTPDYTYCLSNDGNSPIDCSFLSQNKVMTNVIGTPPNTYKYFSYEYNQKLISQLNSNSLMAPLLYSTENTATTPPPGDNSNQEEPGLTAQSQAQQALNFVRYVSGSITPLDLPKRKDYDAIWLQATSDKIPTIQKMQASATLARYLTSIRTYAAQNSVGLSNLYYILSKRMPQNQSTNNSKPSSQAMAEFTSATWRLFNPDLTENKKQWIDQINNASPAAVQKEIAILLAEINYQLYLNRQQEERMLLTNTVLLLQNSKASQPSADLSSTAAAATSSSGN